MISRAGTAHVSMKRDGGALGSSERMGLLEDLQKGNPAAWRRMFQQNARAVYRWSVLLGLSSAEAEDAAQEVLCIAAKKIDQCRSDEGLRPWLFRITRHVAANARRKVWFRRGMLSDVPPEPAFESGDIQGREDELSVRRCLEALSVRHREVLILSDVEGYTRDEVAEVLGIPPGTVASRLRLARRAFRARWDDAWSHRSDMKPSRG